MTKKDASHPLQQDRRSIRLPEYDYSQPGAYFVTITSYKRKCLFAEIDSHHEMSLLTEIGKIVEQVWNSLPTRFPQIILDEAIVMPNHFHAILWIVEGNLTNPAEKIDLLDRSVGAIHELPLQNGQNLSTPQEREERRRIRRQMLLPKIIGYFKMNSAKRINHTMKTAGNPVWQRNYYEHIIRNETELEQIREYIANNPLRWYEDEENPFSQNARQS